MHHQELISITVVMLKWAGSYMVVLRLSLVGVYVHA